ncbi:MAG: hypothetical protein AAB796_02150 [Patescibacteria group bacterium]
MESMEEKTALRQETQEDPKLKREREINMLFSQLLGEVKKSQVGTLEERFWQAWEEKFSSADAIREILPTIYKEAEDNEKKFLKQSEEMGEAGEVWDADEETQTGILLDEIRKDFEKRLEGLANLK